MAYETAGAKAQRHKGTKAVLLNYKGQWYEIDKGSAFKKKWLENNIR